MNRGSATLFALVGTAVLMIAVVLFGTGALPLGTPGGKVIRDPSAAQIPIVLTTDVSGILPEANGGSNADTDFTAGSVLFDDGTRFVQDNANLFFDATNLGLGVGTGTVGVSTRLGVAGAGVFKGILTVQGTTTTSSLIATSTLEVRGYGGSALPDFVVQDGVVGVGSSSPGTRFDVDGPGLFSGNLYVEGTTTVNSLIATSTGAEFRNGGVTTNCKLVSDGIVNPKESNCFEIATTTDGAIRVDTTGIATGEHFNIKVHIYKAPAGLNAEVYFTNGITASGTYYTTATDTPWAVSDGVDVCALWNSTSTLAIFGSCLNNFTDV